MAVVLKKPQRGSGMRSGSWSLQGRQYKTVTMVLTNSLDDGPQIVLDSMGLAYGDIYQHGNDIDEGAFLVGLSCDEDSATQFGAWWKVTADYNWIDANEQGGGSDNNPLLAPLTVSWGFKDVELVAEFDHEKEAIVNSAGEPFDPPLTYQAKIPILTVRRNEALGRYNPALIYQYRDAVSSDTFAGANPGCAKVSQIAGARAYNNDIGPYYEVTYEFEFNPDGYRRRVPSMGMRQVNAAGTEWEQILVKNQPVSSPVLLGEDGRQLPPEDPPFILEFQIHPELPFSLFNFDESELLAQR